MQSKSITVMSGRMTEVIVVEGWRAAAACKKMHIEHEKLDEAQTHLRWYVGTSRATCPCLAVYLLEANPALCPQSSDFLREHFERNSKHGLPVAPNETPPLRGEQS